jgi:hypothetical protein
VLRSDSGHNVKTNPQISFSASDLFLFSLLLPSQYHRIIGMPGLIDSGFEKKKSQALSNLALSWISQCLSDFYLGNL